MDLEALRGFQINSAAGFQHVLGLQVLRQLQAGALLEVIWRENQLILRQDNKERARCFVAASEFEGK